VKPLTHSLIGALAALALLLPAAALADVTGTPGRLVGFEHNDDSSSDFGTDSGRVFVEETAATIRAYRFGGSLCPGDADLAFAQQAMLLDGLAAKLVLQPYYKSGNGGVRCLTSFLLVTKKAYAETLAK
jgi:hypothetical protein